MSGRRECGHAALSIPFQATGRTMAKAFISYSHRNDRALDRLHTHLAMLRRDDLIAEWYDREILAGKDIDREITENLADSDVFLALVSPDFLASNYCYEREMKVALERHAAGTLRVIPIIVEACDWTASPLSKLKALPKDGKPISTWTNEDVAYLDVVTELRRMLEADRREPPGRLAPVPQAERAKAIPETKRYRIKREFDAIDRAEFAHTAFGIIRDYFQRSVDELNQIGDPIRARFEKMSDSAFTCTVLNKGKRNGEANITFHLKGERSFGDIVYSFSFRGPNNTANGHVSVDADEYEQYLVLNNYSTGSDRERHSAEDIAEAIWREFTSHAGVDHD